MRIHMTNVFVDDQQKALDFYTGILGFKKKHDIPVGGDDRWLTVVSAEGPDDVELLLEPSGHRAVGPYKQALKEDGIPAASFAVGNVAQEIERLKGLDVVVTQEPTDVGTAIIAAFDDTCGNLVQLIEMKSS